VIKSFPSQREFLLENYVSLDYNRQSFTKKILSDSRRILYSILLRRSRYCDHIQGVSAAKILDMKEKEKVDNYQ